VICLIAGIIFAFWYNSPGKCLQASITVIPVLAQVPVLSLGEYEGVVLIDTSISLADLRQNKYKIVSFNNFLFYKVVPGTGIFAVW